MNMKSRTWVVAAAALSAVGASACCVLPVLVALLGAGSAAFAATFEPWRPYLLASTVLLLGVAFYQAYRPVECAPGDACALPASRARFRAVLWIVATTAVALLTFPYYAAWLL